MISRSPFAAPFSPVPGIVSVYVPAGRTMVSAPARALASWMADRKVICPIRRERGAAARVRVDGVESGVDRERCQQGPGFHTLDPRAKAPVARADPTACRGMISHRHLTPGGDEVIEQSRNSKAIGLSGHQPEQPVHKAHCARNRREGTRNLRDRDFQAGARHKNA